MSNSFCHCFRSFYIYIVYFSACLTYCQPELFPPCVLLVVGVAVLQVGVEVLEVGVAGALPAEFTAITLMELVVPQCSPVKLWWVRLVSIDRSMPPSGV